MEKNIKLEKVLGTVGTLFALLFFTSLIEIGLSNYRGETSIWMLPLATSINCAIWTTYAIIRKDLLLGIPNLFSAFVGSFTTVVVFI